MFRIVSPTTTSTVVGIDVPAAAGHTFDASPCFWSVQGTTLPIDGRERLVGAATGVAVVDDTSIQGTTVWRPPIC